MTTDFQKQYTELRLLALGSISDSLQHDEVMAMLKEQKETTQRKLFESTQRRDEVEAMMVLSRGWLLAMLHILDVDADDVTITMVNAANMEAKRFTLKEHMDELDKAIGK